MAANAIWVGIGLFGQVLFTSRFLVQWIASERKRESVIPMSFWWLSILGGLTLLCYAIWRLDPVFILGQSTGLIVYIRNVVLIRRKTRKV